MEEHWTGTFGEERTVYYVSVYNSAQLWSKWSYFFFDDESDSFCARHAQLFKCVLLGCWLTCKQEQVVLTALSELERKMVLGRCMSAHNVCLCKTEPTLSETLCGSECFIAYLLGNIYLTIQGVSFCCYCYLKL